MTAPAHPSLVSDPWEMALIHRLIRRGFDQAQEATLAPDATERTGALVEYVGFHLDGLEAHHSTEDELLWPALHERVSMSDALIGRMEAQHADVHDAIETARRELAAWAAARTPSGAAALSTALGDLSGALADHLAEEERDVVPLIAAHITQAEWDHAGKVAFSKFTPKQRFTAMGEMLAAATPTEAARMLAGLPTPVKVVWRVFGRRRYQRLMAEVNG
jgi:hemerythrin-like domain-containing protein